MIERVEIQQLIERIKEPRRFIQVVTGARQIGKTTMVLQALSKTDIANTYESADAVSKDKPNWLSEVWEGARVRMKLGGLSEYLLVVDEIQKLDNWSEIAKKEWDSDSRNNLNIKVILLGSSRLLLQKGLTESLAGRFELILLNHWSFDEMNSAFGWSLDQYIFFGGYPGAAPLINDEYRWRDYVKNALIETSISKDILMLTRIDKPALLKQLFELGSAYSGQVLSFNKILGQLLDAGNTTTLSQYLTLLNDCGLLGGIEKFTDNAVSTRSSSPKFQVYNNSLLTVNLNGNFEQTRLNHGLWGRFVESAIGVHLINNRAKGRYNIYYWREGQAEVDFVIEKDGQIVGLEVKSGAKAINKGMALFAKKYPRSKSFIVGTEGIPLDEFLRAKPEHIF